MNRINLALAVALSTLAVSSTVMADTPATSIVRLQAGNARFVASANAPVPVTNDRRTELAKGQTPFAMVLSCADSRVPPELVFNVGLGDIFTVRAAGEVIDRSVLASVEYGAEHLHAPLLVVMGHESCGAVKAAIESKESMGPNLDYLLAAIRPAVARTAAMAASERMPATVKANVEQVILDAFAKSSVLRELVEEGKLQVVGAYYELASGRVTFSRPVEVPASAHAQSEGH